MPTTRYVQGCTRGTGGDKGRVTLPPWGSQHLVERAQAGRGSQLLPKNLLVLAGWA